VKRVVVIGLFASAASLAGCLNVPSATQTACSTDNDCDSTAGEVCDEGVCWGDPPTGSFAATLGAPSTRSDLVPVEMPLLSIPGDGYLGDLALDAPVTLSGRVETEDRTSVDATITISRPSLFAGGPGFKAVVSSSPNVSGVSFTVAVPPTHDGDPPYQILVMPNGRGDALADSTAVGRSVPPAYTTLSIGDNTVAPTMTLGDPALTTVSGVVLDTTGKPLPHYRVSALGRWDAETSPSEVSSVAYTGSDGAYAITLAAGLFGGVTVVAKPYDTVAPTLELSGFTITASSTHNLSQPANLGTPIALTVPVEGLDSGGSASPVVGARVTITASAVSTNLPNVQQTATMTVEDITDASGNAHLTIVGGGTLGNNYTLSIVPPASSNLGAVFEEPLSLTGLGPTATLDTDRLDPRIAIRGVVVDTDGDPLSNVSVTVRPSLKFLWSLAAEPQAFVTAIPPPTTVTPPTGDFVLWVDPIVAGVWGDYDLDFEPAAGSDTPNWTLTQQEVPRQSGQADLSLGNVTIPSPSFIHGRITDSAGNVVPGGQLRIFELQSSTELCTDTIDPPMTSCAVPAIVRGSGTADADGKVRLSLPRPAN
jgi:protocatechuate 3,4-dioxygenase beta subunit